MKKYIITLTIILSCAFLTACGGKAEQEEPWIGIAPGADLTAVTERTEYYDLAVETEELFEQPAGHAVCRRGTSTGLVRIVS